MKKSDTQNNPACSFCGRSHDEVKKMAGSQSGVYICNYCVTDCTTYFKEDINNESLDFLQDIPTPIDIKKMLDEHIIGQDQAKKVLSVAVYEHFKELKDAGEDDVKLQKANILLIGQSGSGKTLLAETLAKSLNVPFAIADATTLTQAGYVGEDVENILVKLLQAADGDIERAEKGIIFIDEIDKISRKSENPSITRDVSGEGVQQALLKIIEGTVSNIPPQGGRKHPSQQFIAIDTTNILFICGGAFEGIEEIIRKRHTKKSSMGFTAEPVTNNDLDENSILTLIEPDDILKFGIIPELAGRLPVITGLEKLDEKAFLRILTEPKNSLTKQFKKRFSIDNVEIEFATDALELIASKAFTRKTGVRGLRSILEDILLELRFEIPSSTDIDYIRITKEFVDSKNKEDLIFERPVKKTA